MMDMGMMGGMMGLRWLGALLVLGLVIAGVILLVRGSSRPAKIVLGVLAAVGAFALVAAMAMTLMHSAMGCVI